MPADHRLEHDLLGDIDVPAHVYWGAHTERARRNFPITGRPISTLPWLIVGLAQTKAAAAAANRELREIPEDVAGAIVQACAEIEDGQWHDQFVVDVMQGGAGTSTNMNANEVIANRALELLGLPLGSYDDVSPNDHVNRSQSTNDVYPTALRVGLHHAMLPLLSAVQCLHDELEAKRREFGTVVKVGRTQLQDAVPMTLGQEFGAWATTVANDRERLRAARAALTVVNLGGTAIGTGINAHPDYPLLASRALAERTGIDVVSAGDLVEASQDVGALLDLSAATRRFAVRTSKICNDLRLLASGPLVGFADILLPPVQAGSSIMPGKINPVIPEVVNEVAFAVIGRDTTVTLAAEAGQLQLNAFEPVIARALFESISELTAACNVLADRCIKGITARPDQLRAKVLASAGLATALAPALGYRAAGEVAKAALASRATIPATLATLRLDTKPEVRELLANPMALTGRQLAPVGPATPNETGT